MTFEGKRDKISGMTDVDEGWNSKEGENRTNGRKLPKFHLVRHATQQAILRGENVLADSGTDMTEQQISDFLMKLTTPEARDRFLKTFKEE